MRGRRLFPVVLIALVALAASCAEVDTQDETQPTGTARQGSSAQQACIAGEGEGPAIEWQNTTVDIEPASRFGDEADIAYVTTTIAASEDEAEGVRRELEELDGVELDVSEDGRLFTVRQRVEVPEVDDDEFRFSMTAPLEGTQLAKDGDVSVIVQLPRSSEGKENVPAYEVELVSATTDEDVPEATIHDGEANPLIGERITVAWYWCVDPPLDVVYRSLFG